MFGFSFNIWSNNSGSVPTIETPQDIALSELTLGEVVVSWTDVAQSVDGYKVYRRLTSVGGSWGTALGTIAEGVGNYTDTTIASDTEYDYKVVAYIGAYETTAENLGENLSSITTYDLQTGLLFADGDRIAYPSTKTYTGVFNIQIGIQGLSDASGSTGFIGAAGGTSNRILLSPSLNKIRANIAGGSLLSSPALSPVLDLADRRIIEVYRDGSDDVYLIDGVNPTQFLFNKSGTFSVDSIFVTGGFGTAGYLYYINDGDQEWLVNEGSGASLVSVDTTVTLTITPLAGGLPYIDGTMWTAALPPPVGFITFDSLSVSARSTSNLNDNLGTAPGSYTPGTVEFNVASITDTNPEGYTHAIITTLTNDIGNPTKFLTPTEYETALTGAVQKLKTAGLTPIICTSGTIVTSILQAAKDFDATIGAMLSGDPLNPTPEADWDFNSTLGSTVDEVIPLYIAKASAVATAESVTFIDTFQHFIDGGTYPNYSDWISADGIHYTTTGYTEYGTKVATILDTLGWTGVEKVCVLGDSLGNGIATQIGNAYNS